MSDNSLESREIHEAFAEYDRNVTISNFKVACALGMVLMPAGILLDRAMYKDMVIPFLELRLLCSALIGLFLAVLLTPFGRRRYRVLGVTLFMLPASFAHWGFAIEPRPPPLPGLF